MERVIIIKAPFMCPYRCLKDIHPHKFKCIKTDKDCDNQTIFPQHCELLQTEMIKMENTCPHHITIKTNNTTHNFCELDKNINCTDEKYCQLKEISNARL